MIVDAFPFSNGHERSTFFFFTCLGALRWKDDLQQKASEVFLKHQQAAPNLRKHVYGTGKVSECQDLVRENKLFFSNMVMIAIGV